MMVARFIFTVLVVLLSTATLAEERPEDVAARYLEAVRDRGFAAGADFLHPDEMARFQQLLVPVLESEQAAGGRALLNATFGRDATLLSARLADPADFLRRFARVMAVRAPDQPTGFDQLQILGTVNEGETIHVLARLRTALPDGPSDRLVVVSLRPFEDGWRVMLSPEIEQAARAMVEPLPSGRQRPRPLQEPEPLPLEAERR
ncbi:MAG: hypothetical protein MUC77_09225 [Chromatiaceae bacterium]|jgi:hypothetical protein|nr:hypothetical protein [Chromatiaceae bacterium]